MSYNQFSDINLTQSENKPRTIVKRAWEVGQLTIVVIDKALAQTFQIADGTVLEQVPAQEGILLRVGGRQPE
ncbi:MAG: hypothetical protein HRF40_03730 [Nitrososphaera sp.]